MVVLTLSAARMHGMDDLIKNSKRVLILQAVHEYLNKHNTPNELHIPTPGASFIRLNNDTSLEIDYHEEQIILNSIYHFHFYGDINDPELLPELLQAIKFHSVTK